ncbi:MAG TPA: radical SAM protein [Planctomycetota bacterium]
MIDFSYLYAGRESGSTPHRYGQALKAAQSIPSEQRHAVAQSASSRKPIVVWNISRTCNLTCEHCYTASGPMAYKGELTTDEGKRMIDDLAEFKIPALLLSGGEPILRPDFFELAEYAVSKKLRLVVSTNGTLITPEVAERLKKTGFTYVGISLDGLREVHDHFRRKQGAFDLTVAGFRNCMKVGQKVGLRLTLTKSTARDLPGIFDFIEAEGIQRVCFYHLVPAGRGKGVEDLTLSESRGVIDAILARTKKWAEQNRSIELLTVDNHCDGPYLYLKLIAEGRTEHAKKVLDFMRWNGGGLYSSGVGIADVDFNGNVHADQFWMTYSFGNVRERRFSEIWQDVSDPIMAGLKNRKGKVTGRCATCCWFDMCGGAMRSRAFNATGDPWASDPGCYLTDEEIKAIPTA